VFRHLDGLLDFRGSGQYQSFGRILLYLKSVLGHPVKHHDQHTSSCSSLPSAALCCSCVMLPALCPCAARMLRSALLWACRMLVPCVSSARLVCVLPGLAMLIVVSDC
jgi:hypothetical protein